MTPPPLYPLPGETAVSRRAFLGTASFAAAALLTGRLRGADVGASVRFPAYPFALGVASGDPAPDGFVLWTRLAPLPFQPGGGLSSESVAVKWQVCADVGSSRVDLQACKLEYSIVSPK